VILGALGASSAMMFAVLGAVVAVTIVLWLGGRSHARGVVPLLLAGAVVSAVLYAYINAMVLLKPGVFDSYRFWMVGSLAGVQLEHLTKLVIPLLVGTLLALGVARSMNALALGNETAISLGFNVGRTRLFGIIAA